MALWSNWLNWSIFNMNGYENIVNGQDFNFACLPNSSFKTIRHCYKNKLKLNSNRPRNDM